MKGCQHQANYSSQLKIIYPGPPYVWKVATSQIVKMPDLSEWGTCPESPEGKEPSGRSGAQSEEQGSEGSIKEDWVWRWAQTSIWCCTLPSPTSLANDPLTSWHMLLSSSSLAVQPIPGRRTGFLSCLPVWVDDQPRRQDRDCLLYTSPSPRD